MSRVGREKILPDMIYQRGGWREIVNGVGLLRFVQLLDGSLNHDHSYLISSSDHILAISSPSDLLSSFNYLWLHVRLQLPLEEV